jgi:hypothetical protein
MSALQALNQGSVFVFAYFCGVREEKRLGQLSRIKRGFSIKCGLT